MRKKFGTLIAERSELKDRAKKILDSAEAEKRSLTATEQSQFDTLVAEAEELSDTIERRGKIEAIPSGHTGGDPSRPFLPMPDPNGPGIANFGRARPGGNPEYPGHLDDGTPVLGPEQRFADLRSYGLGVAPADCCIGREIRARVTGDWKHAEAEKRALDGANLSLGGAVLSPATTGQFIDLVRDATVTRTLGVRTVPMESRNMVMGKLTQDATVYGPLSEHERITASDLGFGMVKLEARTLAARCEISKEWIADAINGPDLITQSLRATAAVALDGMVLRGQHPGEIGGIRFDPDVAKTDFSSTSAPDWDDLFDARGALMARNVPTDGLGCAIAPSVWNSIQKQKDSNGEYRGIPQAFEGTRFAATNSIPTNLGGGSDESELVIGQFSSVIIGIRQDAEVEFFDGPEATDTGRGFSTRTVHVRLTLRADVAVTRPDHFQVLHGFVPIA